MNPKTNLAVIGGSGAYNLLKARGFGKRVSIRSLKTPFGKSAPVHLFQTEDFRFLFLSRHGETGYSVSAPFVNYRANIWALKEMGAERIVAWSGPGILNPKIKVGDFVIPHDLIDETRNRDYTFFEKNGLGFIRQSEPFCPEIRESARKSLKSFKKTHHAKGVYVCTEGPRLETRAEIKKFVSMGGDLVGMTLIPEVFLARELEICYAAVCYTTNYAEGIKKRPFEAGRLFEGMASESEMGKVNRSVLEFPQIIRGLFSSLLSTSKRGAGCSCGQAMERYKREGVIGEDWRRWFRA